MATVIFITLCILICLTTGMSSQSVYYQNKLNQDESLDSVDVRADRTTASKKDQTTGKSEASLNASSQKLADENKVCSDMDGSKRCCLGGVAEFGTLNIASM